MPSARTVRLDATDTAHRAEIVRRSVETLRRGGVLVHPTATVYGLGTLATPSGVDLLRGIKGRDDGKPFVALVFDRAQVAALKWTPEARRLAERFWPGPLTLVLDILLDIDGTTGDVRSRYGAGPDDGVAIRETPSPLLREILRELGEPMLSTSVNRAGTAPAGTAEEVWEFVEQSISGDFDADVVFLDVGTLPPSPPSTVIDCTKKPPRPLRVGALPLERIAEGCPGVFESPSELTLARTEEMQAHDSVATVDSGGTNSPSEPSSGGHTPFTTVFVCTGNTCRSPLAEAIARRIADAGDGPPLRFLSAGTSARPGSPASEGSIEVAAKHGLDLSGHSSRPVSDAILDEADLVLTMSESHLQAIRMWAEDMDAYLLTDFVKSRADEDRWGVQDPFGGGPDDYEATYRALERLIEAALTEIHSMRNR